MKPRRGVPVNMETYTVAPWLALPGGHLVATVLRANWRSIRLEYEAFKRDHGNSTMRRSGSEIISPTVSTPCTKADGMGYY